MNRRDFLRSCAWSASAAFLPWPLRPRRKRELPNIVYILADDLGYGDVSCFNENSKIRTPHIDRLASEGMRFTDAHSASAVCTPTRYGIMTGRYCWRTRLKKGVLGGYSPSLIEPDRLTVAAMLRQHGYATACFGKWHLGMDWALTGGEKPSDAIRNASNIDFAKRIRGGPVDRGFDYYFGISGSLDMPPYTFIENDRTVGIPTEITKEGGREGLTAKGFRAVDVLPTLTGKAVEYIARARSPFFFYFPLSAPHGPIVPAAEWQGKSGLNAYADFVMQTDAAIGEVISALDRAGVADNTLVIVTSDNGCSPIVKFDELIAKRHNPNHVFRGHKADIWEGGHRIPFVARWPGRIATGSVSGETVCLNDLMATCAAIVGAKLPVRAGEDSFNMLPALTGRKSDKPVREATVHHSINGAFAIRKGRWKLVLSQGSGGWSRPKEGKESEGLPPVQLYDLSEDLGEQNNVHARHPDVVEELKKLLEKYVAEGRSAPVSRPGRDSSPDSSGSSARGET